MIIIFGCFKITLNKASFFVMEGFSWFDSKSNFVWNFFYANYYKSLSRPNYV